MSAENQADISEETVDLEENTEKTTKNTTIQPPKKKKKKKKVHTRAEEELLLQQKQPPHITSWEIAPPIVEGEEDTLTFYTDGEPTTYVEINEENLEGLVDALNSQIIVLGDKEVTEWTIRYPEDTSLPPLFSLLSNSGIIGTIPLEQKMLKTLVPELLKIYSPKKKGLPALISYIEKHQKKSIAFGTIFGAMLIYSVVVTYI